MIKELDGDKTFVRNEELKLPSGDQDFVVNMLPDAKHGMLFLLTKSGHLLIYEVQSCKCIFSRQVTQTTFFVSGSNTESGGVVAADTSGRVVQFSIDEESLVPFVTNVLADMEMGVKLAQRCASPPLSVVCECFFVARFFFLSFSCLVSTFRH